MFTGKTFVWNSCHLMAITPETAKETPGDLQFPVTWVYATTVFPEGTLKFRYCYCVTAWMWGKAMETISSILLPSMNRICCYLLSLLPNHQIYLRHTRHKCHWYMRITSLVTLSLRGNQWFFWYIFFQNSLSSLSTPSFSLWISFKQKLNLKHTICQLAFFLLHFTMCLRLLPMTGYSELPHFFLAAREHSIV